MGEPKLNALLNWSTANSSSNRATTTTDGTSNGTPNEVTSGITNSTGTATNPSPNNLNPEMLSALFGGPSDAELMKAALQLLTSKDPEITHTDRLTAFDNLEQLIESLDNANNLEPLQLWKPLISLLQDKNADIRKYAAWCIGTAVQNNEKTQKKLVEEGGIEKLVDMATDEEEHKDVRRKAVYALSSAVRNFQEGCDRLTQKLRMEKVDAGDMEGVDGVVGPLKEKAVKRRESVEDRVVEGEEVEEKK